MQAGLNLEPLIDELANKVAAKVSAQLANSSGSGVRPRLLSLEQAANYIGRTLPAVQHMVSEGQVPTVRSDRRVFVDVRDLDEWIEKNKYRI
jgi:excisionase family DNA binding protein